MAITIDATVGGASANSYVTLAEADSYMEGRLNASAWETDATTDNKNRALAEATRWLTAATWLGYRVDDTQALSWPRAWVIDPDDPNADYFAQTVVPERVKRATYELALEFIKAGTTDIAAIDSTIDIKRKKIDVLETEYYDRGVRANGLAKYPAATREIAPMLAGSPLTSDVVKS